MKVHKPYGAFIIGVACVGAVFLLLPVAVITYFSFQDGTYFQLLPKGFSLRWYLAAASNQRFVQAASRSLLIAAVVTPTSLALSVPTAMLLVRRSFALKGLVNVLIMSPVLVPGVVSGVAFLTFFGQIGVDAGLGPTVIAMICFTYPFAVRAIVANLQGIGLVWEEAAESLGASRWFTWRHVLLPLLRPGLLAGGIFVFVEAIDNFSIAVFLVNQRTSTLPVEIFSYIKDFDDPSVSVVAVASVVMSTAFMILVERLVGLERFLRLG